MRILKSELIGLLLRTVPREQGFGLVASAYACFSLAEKDQGRLLAESAMWQLLRKALQPSDIFDMGYPKPGAEFLLYGRCFPVSTGATGMSVSVQAGEMRKTLQVMGPRRWQNGRCSAPEALDPVRLDWTQAYGGPAYARNPLGKGHTQDTRADGLDAPQLLRPNELLTRSEEEHQPVCFSALPPFWPQRTQLLGAFDDHWKYNDWPYLPGDSKAEYFFTSQPDQRQAAFLKGDEFLTIEGAHPQRPVITGRLPNLRARIFAMTRKSGRESFSELPAPADTLWLLPEQEAAIVCYRGVLQGVEEDAEDVAHLLAAWEPLDSRPLPEEQYLQMLRSELEPQVESEAAPQAAPVEKPVVPVAQEQAKDGPELPATPAEALAEAPEEAPELQALKRDVAEFEAVVNARLAQLGKTPEEVEALIQSWQPKMEEPSHAINLEENLAALEQDMDRLLDKLGVRQEEMQRLLDERQIRPPAPEALEEFFQQALARPELTPEQRKVLLEMRQAHGEMLELSQKLESLPTEESRSENVPEPGEGASSAAAEITETAESHGYVGKDFSGADFSGQNLAYVDFRNATLDGADFSNAVLVGADFSGAMLRSAVFTGALLVGTQFAGVQANGAICIQTELLGANLNKADFSESDFSESSFDCADLSGCDFTNALLRRITAKGIVAEKVSFSHADLTEAFFHNADLRQAEFSGAVLQQAVFRASNADKAEFYAASGKRVSFLDASIINSRADHRTCLHKLVLRNVKMDEARWSGADLTGARLWNVTLDRGDFSNTSLEKVVMLRVRARWANANKASIEGASMRRVNMFRGTLRKARIVKTRVQLANLFGADHYGVYIRNRRAKDSNIKRTLRERTSDDA